jgi:hypothetical protein
MKEPCFQSLKDEGVGERERNAANSTTQETKVIDEKSKDGGQTRVKNGVARVKQHGGSDARQTTTCSCLSGSECKLGSQDKGSQNKSCTNSWGRCTAGASK